MGLYDTNSARRPRVTRRFTRPSSMLHDTHRYCSYHRAEYFGPFHSLGDRITMTDETRAVDVVEINCETGEVTEREYTPEEHAALLVLRNDYDPTPKVE